MIGNEPINGRSLAQLESDLLKAEAAFTDAENRLKEAERDRSAALDTINEHQLAFDEAIAKLRRGSAAGSRWRRDVAESVEDTLVLQPKDIAQEVIPPSPPRTPGLAYVRLTAVAQSDGW